MDLAATTKRIAVVLFNFSNLTTQPYTTTFAAGVAFTNANSVAAYYAETSWGQLTLTGDVFGWYTIPLDHHRSGLQLRRVGRLGQRAGGRGRRQSQHLRSRGLCVSLGVRVWLVGAANMPGRNSWLNGASAMGLRVMAHELGHNFGTHHSSSLSCTVGGTRVSIAPPTACTSSEYGDPFSVMGQPTSTTTRTSREATSAGSRRRTPDRHDGRRLHAATDRHVHLERRAGPARPPVIEQLPDP